MQNLLEDLTQLLSQDERLIAKDGALLKNRIVEFGLKLDPDLLRLLLSHDRIRQHFFAEVDGILVFDKDKFLQFVSNKEFLPDSYTAFKNKIGLSDDGGETYLSRRREVALVWPYKDCVLEGGQTQEDARRHEVFWNTTLAPDDIDRLLDPKVLTGWRRYDADGEHPVTDLRPDDNLILKGNNLLALHSHVRRFGGRVKLIYIDPPYNTGNDSFGYNDRFNHSTWLTFMKNRLEISKELLALDGFIFISCDDNEQSHLKLLCDDIFGPDNFVSNIIIQSNKRGQTYKQIAKTHEYLLAYSKSDQAEIKELEKESDFSISDDIGGYELRELRNRNPKFGRFNRPNLYFPVYVNLIAKDADGLCPISLNQDNNFNHEVLPLNSTDGESCWRWGKEKVTKNSDANTRISNLVAKEKTTGEYGIYEKYRKQTYKAKSIWVETSVINEQGTMELRNMGLGDKFPFPKPSYLIKKVIRLATDEDSIIMDFFAGSGTTAQAVLDLNLEDGGNRQFILCEQMKYIETVTVERIKRVIETNGQGSFTYCELLPWNETFIEKIQAAQDTATLQIIWEEMQAQAFLSYKVDVAAVNAHAEDFADLTPDEQKRFLLETLDHNALYVNLSEIDDADYGVSDEDKRLNAQFYGQEA